MTDTFNTKRVDTDEQIQELAALASTIWHEHFTPIIGIGQVEYMLDKFQSAQALQSQLLSGYEYYQLYDHNEFCGYCGIHQEDTKLFLSKLYIRKECRGRHLATNAFHFLKNLSEQRGLSCIWLTCNKYNENTLSVYRHFGFDIVDTQEADIGNGYIMDDYIMEYKLKKNETA